MIVLYLIRLLFGVYTMLLFIAIVGSWFPSFAYTRFMRFIRFYVDPYLQIFRKIIPPIGGVLDLSPLLAFFGLQLGEYLLIRLWMAL